MCTDTCYWGGVRVAVTICGQKKTFLKKTDRDHGEKVAGKKDDQNAARPAGLIDTRAGGRGEADTAEERP